MSLHPKLTFFPQGGQTMANKCTLPEMERGTMAGGGQESVTLDETIGYVGLMLQ